MSLNTANVPMALNAISALTIHGLITDSDGSNIPVILRRTAAALDLVPFLDLVSVAALDRPRRPYVPRPPSTLPEPGDLHVNLTFGDKKGWGRSSFVHEVNVLPTTTLPAHLPPLVLKVARSKRRAEIAREAWFYDELECLQGVVLPRCYGWFEAELTEGQSFGPWTATRKSRDTENSNPEWRFKGSKLKEMSGSRNYVSVLLLEKLGDTLPMGVPLGDELVKGLYDLFGEISELGVDHRDIRYSNILAAPEGPDTLPSLPSPFTGQVYTHRIIDIEQCEKTNGKTWLLTNWQGSWVQRIVSNLPDGIIIEPWD
ncbi:hypothetical protein BS47DRAFT_1334772 [Hydnum rufescens UP504]|uniref:Protein kinase domain-containing protein n=1 Tax=Hydnum rufescens UP504 TaxID=1448309 RepID=A0A9P6AED6_9AGAM|nr:hypothetical protein BS47DRAFT_1334772 [Hydnum rufescens UP504]